MIYFLVTILIISIIMLLLNLRLIFRVNEKEKFLFAGLGRSGGEFDFSKKTGVIKLFGLSVKQFDIFSTEEKDKAETKKKRAKEKKKSKRTRSFKQILKIIRGSLNAFKNYIISILKNVVVEEMEGKIEGGFDSIDLTGQAYGYYQAVCGAVPSISQRLIFIPHWEENYLKAEVKGAVALPLYVLCYRTAILIFSLPLRKIIKFTIGKKKGGHDGQ